MFSASCITVYPPQNAQESQEGKDQLLKQNAARGLVFMHESLRAFWPAELRLVRIANNIPLPFWNYREKPSGRNVAGVCLAPVTAFTTLALCPADHTARRASVPTRFYWVYGHERFCCLLPFFHRRDLEDDHSAWQSAGLINGDAYSAKLCTAKWVKVVCFFFKTPMVVTAAAAGWPFVKVIFMLCVWQSNGHNFYSYNQMGTGPAFSLSTSWQDRWDDANPSH